jgi:hypothetical protein
MYFPLPTYLVSGPTRKSFIVRVRSKIDFNEGFTTLGEIGGDGTY